MYDDLTALQSLVENIKLMDCFEKLTLVLHSNNFWSAWARGLNNNLCRNNEKILDEMKSLILHKHNLKIELVRMAPQERVCSADAMAEAESWMIYGCEAEDALVI